MNQYTPEQEKDIREREAKAIEHLKELQLSPAAILQKVNVGNDMFVDKVIPYLQDFKYKSVSIDKNELEKKA